MKKIAPFRNLSFTLPPNLVIQIEELNEAAEHDGGFSIGRSFIVRFALEEFLRRLDSKNALIERKIENIRGKQLV